MRCVVMASLMLFMMTYTAPAMAVETQSPASALAKLTEQAQPLPFTVNFKQSKFLAGLPRALISSGEVTVTQEAVVWVTTAPQQQTLRITSQGIFAGNATQSATGSEAIAELLLAVLKHDQDTLKTQFDLHVIDNCVQMTPRNDALSSVIQSIKSCGDARVERVVLQESNGNKTRINFTETTR